MLDADAIRVGAVYIEEDSGSDLHGDTFEVTFAGGAAETELTQLIIDGNQSAPGFGDGDVFFDTVDGGIGADNAFPFELNSFSSQNPNASVRSTVSDGSSQLTLDLVGFQAGDKLVFSIDVDEVEDFDPLETDQQRINEGIDPLTSGVEFQRSLFTAKFSAPHYHDVTAVAEFRNEYDAQLVGLELDLPADNAAQKRDRTAGVGLQVTQPPVLAEISGFVYHDRSDDGSRDPGEEGLGGVSVQVIPVDTVEPQSTVSLTTDPNGFYHATGLIPGSYRIVEASQPTNFFDGLDTAGTINGVQVGNAANPGDNLEGIFLGGGTAGVEYNFGELAPASIRGSVHLTDRDGNCFTTSSTERGIEGVTIRLLDAQNSSVAETQTDTNGSYEFTNLRPGQYSVVEVTPAALIDGEEHVGTISGVVVGQAGAGDLLSGIVLGSGAEAIDYNFCEHAPASLSGFVYHDANDNGIFEVGEEPIGNVSVALHDSSGSVVGNQQTGPDGSYRFGGLRAGTYSVVESQPIGWIDGRDSVGRINGATVGVAGNDRISQAALKWGDEGVEYNFGELRPASISGYVYHDRANDATRDPGDEGIVGVELQVTRVTGGPGQTPITVTTNSDGYYEANGLAPGEYRVVESQPNSYQDGFDTAGTVGGVVRGTASNPGDEIGGILLTSGDAGVQYNFGEYQLASISGHVHLSDPNGDCFGPGTAAPGLVDVLVNLLDDTGATIATTRTDGNGEYQFDGLLPGVYSVVEQTPNGLIDGQEHVGTVSGQAVGAIGGNDLLSAIALASGQQGVNYDFCEHEPASLAGNVFHDRDNDGSFEPGEEGIGGIEIVLRDASGAVVTNGVTEQDGSYEFTGLAAGTYTLTERQPLGWIDGKDSAGVINGQTVGTASNDQISGIVLRWNEEGSHYNFGEYRSATISGIVHADTDQDCIVDSGEARLEGVTIELLDEQGDVVATTQTNELGEYEFAGLAPGTYAVRETQPVGYFDGGEVIGSGGGAVVASDLVSGISVTSGDELSGYNFCELPPSGLSGFVFQDGGTITTEDGEPPADLLAIRDGQRTPDDTPIAGVVLQLRDGATGLVIEGRHTLPGSNPKGPVRATTDANGFYEFSGLLGGREYAVYQFHPDGYHDSIDTGGSPSAFAFNVGTVVPLQTLSLFADAPRFDAIIHIPVAIGTVAQNNNFSEVLIEADPPSFPPPLPPPPPPTPPLPPAVIPPLLAPAPAPIGIVAPLLNVYAGGVGGAVGFTWHLSVINGGQPREVATDHSGSDVWQQARYLDYTQWNAEHMRSAAWTLTIGHHDSDDALDVRRYVFGVRGGVPVSGDYNGDGVDEIAIFYRGEWFIDLNGNGYWDNEDLWAQLGGEEDLPVTGDWDGDGKDDIGTFGPEWLGDPRAIEAEPGLADPANPSSFVTIEKRPKNVPPSHQDATDGSGILQLNEQGARRLDVVDHVFRFGAGRDIPVTGDWNGDGIRSVGVFHDGRWQLDLNGDGRWSESDAIIQYGETGDVPVVGDFDGNGVEEIGIYRCGKWMIDSDGDRALTAHDRVFEMGGASDHPVVGDWDGDGVDEPGLYREVEDQRDTDVSN